MIIAFSGKKQSGKTTAGNFIASVFMANMNISKNIRLNDLGEIEVSDLLDNDCYKGKFDPSNMDQNDFVLNKVANMLNPKIKLYSFADRLKRDICMNILGLTYDQCYGTDTAKNSVTDLRWCDMPGYAESWINEFNIDSSGLMTARQVMEFVGTNIFRNMKDSVWVDATLGQISRDKSKLAVITDCRFPNEISAVKNAGGKVVRLTRSLFDSKHKSENILNKDQYDWNNFDYIIDNASMSIYEQCIEIEKILVEVLSL